LVKHIDELFGLGDGSVALPVSFEFLFVQPCNCVRFFFKIQQHQTIAQSKKKERRFPNKSTLTTHFPQSAPTPAPAHQHRHTSKHNLLTANEEFTSLGPRRGMKASGSDLGCRSNGFRRKQHGIIFLFVAIKIISKLRDFVDCCPSNISENIFAS